MAHELRSKLGRLDLPLPLEPLLNDVLAQDEPVERHRRILLAWEIALQTMAVAAWAACRQLGLRSEEMAEACAGLRRPLMGTWAKLLRASISLLRDRRDAQCVALAPLIGGLTARDSAHRDANPIVEAMQRLPRPVHPQGQHLLGLLDAMVTYRNRCVHPDCRLDQSILSQNADLLLVGIIDTLYAVPPMGAYRLVVPYRVIRDNLGTAISLMLMHGPQPRWDRVALDERSSLATALGRPCMSADHRSTLIVWPLAAAEQARDGSWRLGLLKDEVSPPRFRYAPYVQGSSFHADLGPDEYRDLLGGIPQRTEESLPDAVLAMAPFRGLTRYDEIHAPLFFGRETETTQILERLEECGAVVVCSASGAGKSSLLRAGVLAKLREKSEHAEPPRAFAPLLLVPGSSPIASLRDALLRCEQASSPSEQAQWRRQVWAALPEMQHADPREVEVLLASLAASGRDVALCVDQLEEIITQCEDPLARRSFLDLLSQVACKARTLRIAVVLAVRGDLMEGLLEHKGIRDLLAKNLYPLGGMCRDALRSVISGPVRGRNAAVDPELVEELIREVGEEPGRIPLLSQVLTCMWSMRGNHGNRLTVAGYRDVGALEGAVRKPAEACWEALTPAGKANMTRILVRLATVSGNGALVSKRVPMPDLCQVTGLDEANLRELMSEFVQNRILTLGQVPAESPGEPSAVGEPETAAAGMTTVQLVHEALLKGWPYLRNLLDSQGQAVQLQADVSAAAQAWHASGRRREMWTDSTTRLRRCEELRSTGQLGFTNIENEFLDSSRRYASRLVRLWRAAMAGLVLLLATVGLLYWQTLESERQAIVQGQEKNEALEEKEDALLLAAAETARASDSDAKTKKALADREAALERVTASVDNAKLREAQSRYAAQMADGAVLSARTLAREAAARSLRDDDPTAAVALLRSEDPHGAPNDWLASLESVTRNPISSLIFGLPGFWGPARYISGFDIDERKRLVVTAYGNGLVTLWNLDSGREVRSDAFGDWITPVAFNSTASHYVAVSHPDPSVQRKHWGHLAWVVGVDDPSEVAKMEFDHTITAVAWSPRDEAVLALALRDGSLRIRNFKTNTDELHLDGHSEAAVRLEYAADGSLLLSTSLDKTLIAWDLRTGGPRRRLRLARLDVQDDRRAPMISHLAPDGRSALVLVDGCPNVFLWSLGEDVQDGFEDSIESCKQAERGKKGTIAVLAGHQPHAISAGWSADSKMLAAGSADGTLLIWDARSRRQIASTPSMGEQALSLAFDPRGERLAAGYADGSIRAWSTSSGAAVAQMSGHAGEVNEVRFDPSTGDLLSMSLWDSAIRRWTRWTPKPSLVLSSDRNGAIVATRLTADGAHLVTGHENGSIGIWDSASGNLLGSLTAHSATVQALDVDTTGGTRVLSVDKTGLMSVAVWDGVSLAQRLVLGSPGETVRTAAFGGDSKDLVLAGTDCGTVHVWDSRYGDYLMRFPTARAEGDKLSTACADPVLGIELLPGQERMVTATSGTVLLWDLTARRPIAWIQDEEHRPIFPCLMRREDGSLRVLTRDHTGRSMLWSAEDTFKHLDTFGVSASGVRLLAHGKFVATTDEDADLGRVSLWNTDTGKLAHRFRLLGSGRETWILDRDGHLLAVGQPGGEIIVTELDGPQRDVVRLNAGSQVVWLEFDPTSRRLFAVTSDGRLLAWDLDADAVLEQLWDATNYCPSPQDEAASGAPWDRAVARSKACWSRYHGEEAASVFFQDIPGGNQGPDKSGADGNPWDAFNFCLTKGEWLCTDLQLRWACRSGMKLIARELVFVFDPVDGKNTTIGAIQSRTSTAACDFAIVPADHDKTYPFRCCSLPEDEPDAGGGGRTP